jgi:hypothetical protein
MIFDSKKTGLLSAITLLLVASNISSAQQQPPEFEAIPEPPPLPEKVQSGESLEPDVRIVRKDKSTVTEYRVNGIIRAIKVQPDGDYPPYYLYDTDANGSLDRRTGRYDPDLLIPHWTIFSW